MEPVQKLVLTDDGEKLHQHYTGCAHADKHGYIEPDSRWYVNTGSYLKKYSNDGDPGYAEMAGYDPVELGHIRITIEGGVLADVSKAIFNE